MAKKQSESSNAKLVGISALLITTAIAPFAIDPVNSIKFQIILFLGVCIIYNLAKNMQTSGTNLVPKFLGFWVLFLVSFLLTVLFANGSERQQIFGTFGRNNGFLTSVSLMLVALFVSNFTMVLEFKTVLDWFAGATTLSALYGFIQIIGLDPVNWTGEGSQVIGSLGNTNFQSTLMSLGALVFLIRLCFRQLAANRKLLESLILVLHLFVMFKTNSIQGFLILCTFPVILFFVFLSRVTSTRVKSISLLLFFSLGLSLLLGLFGFGFFSRVFNVETIEFRRNYWTAGFGMIRENPWLGVGFDSYGDWYRLHRPETLNTALSVVSNSAHNYFIDIAANLGIPALIFYLTLLAYVMKCSLPLIGIDSDKTWIHLSVVTLLLGLLAQSLISPPQLGLQIWLYIFAGAIVGLSRLAKSDSKHALTTKPKPSSRFQVSQILIAVLISSVLASPVFAYQVAIRNSLDSQDFAKIEKAVSRKPADEVILFRVSEIATYNKLFSQEQRLLIQATKSNPFFYEAWERLYLSESTNLQLKKIALERMKLLEPKWQSIINNTL